MDRRISVEIIKVVKESESAKTFYVKNCFGKIKPGQFLMVTDYETGEKPFSISDYSDTQIGITVKKVGDFTNRMYNELKKGDRIYIRGMYGNHFDLSEAHNKKVLVVGGGCGTAPLRFLTTSLMNETDNITVINGSTTEKEFIFKDNYSLMGLRTINVTDDGSFGEKGTSVDIMRSLLEKESFDIIYVAGPELMMKSALNLLNTLDKHKNTPAYFLLERYMKCAVGLCGQCTVDPVGIRLCVEGPVIDKNTLETFTEFGDYTRDKSGKKVHFGNRSKCCTFQPA